MGNSLCKCKQKQRSLSVNDIHLKENEIITTPSIYQPKEEPINKKHQNKRKQQIQSIELDQFYQHEHISLESFKLLKTVGRGSYGKVIMVEYKERIFAMKEILKEKLFLQNEQDHTINERNSLVLLNNPFIVKLHWTFQTDCYLYMIMDFINGGDLFHHLQIEHHFSESKAKFYIGEITIALLYLHDQGIIYRDMKPENIMIDSTGHIILTDLGLSKQLDNTKRTKSICGTAPYVAPEIITGSDYDFQVDWWSLGIVLYEMVIGCKPFDHNNQQILFNYITYYEPLLPESLSLDCQEVIKSLLHKNPLLRWNGLNILESNWFKDINKDKLHQRSLEPPWIPHLNNKTDTSNFDDEFLQIDVHSEVPILCFDYENYFDGFEYSRYI